MKVPLIVVALALSLAGCGQIETRWVNSDTTEVVSLPGGGKRVSSSIPGGGKKVTDYDSKGKVTDNKEYYPPEEKTPAVAAYREAPDPRTARHEAHSEAGWRRDRDDDHRSRDRHVVRGGKLPELCYDQSRMNTRPPRCENSIIKTGTSCVSNSGRHGHCGWRNCEYGCIW